MSDAVFRKANQLWEKGQLAKAFRLFRFLAENGDQSAQINVGHFYDVGIGVAKDPHMALLWYKKALRKGSAAACSNIATVYRDAGNVQRARMWFLRAIEHGDGDAALALAKMYLASRQRERLQNAVKFLHLAQASTNITEDSQQQVSSLIASLEQVSFE